MNLDRKRRHPPPPSPSIFRWVLSQSTATQSRITQAFVFRPFQLRSGKKSNMGKRETKKKTMPAKEYVDDLERDTRGQIRRRTSIKSIIQPSRHSSVFKKRYIERCSSWLFAALMALIQKGKRKSGKKQWGTIPSQLFTPSNVETSVQERRKKKIKLHRKTKKNSFDALRKTLI